MRTERPSTYTKMYQNNAIIKNQNGAVRLQADGSLIFLEANRDPSWVIDGGAKQAIIPALVRDLLPGSAQAPEGLS